MRTLKTIRQEIRRVDALPRTEYIRGLLNGLHWIAGDQKRTTRQTPCCGSSYVTSECLFCKVYNLFCGACGKLVLAQCPCRIDGGK